MTTVTTDALTDWWQVLGVAPGASKSDLDRALARRRRLFHPDRVAQLSADEQALAAEELDRALRAHDVLTTPRLRAEWEAARAAATAPPTQSPPAGTDDEWDTDWDDDWGQPEPEPSPHIDRSPAAVAPHPAVQPRPFPRQSHSHTPVSVGRVLGSVAAALFILTPMTNFMASHVLPGGLRDLSPLLDLAADAGFLWVTIHGVRRR